VFTHPNDDNNVIKCVDFDVLQSHGSIELLFLMPSLIRNFYHLDIQIILPVFTGKKILINQANDIYRKKSRK